jgi:hypothetical protein
VLDFDAKQLEAIGTASLVDRVRVFLAQEFADARSADQLALAGEVRARLDDARLYGLDTSAAAATFIVLAWLFGGGFERTDDALRALLEDRSRPAHEKRVLLEVWALGAVQRLRGGPQ